MRFCAKVKVTFLTPAFTLHGTSNHSSKARSKKTERKARNKTIFWLFLFLEMVGLFLLKFTGRISQN